THVLRQQTGRIVIAAGDAAVGVVQENLNDASTFRAACDDITSERIDHKFRATADHRRALSRSTRPAPRHDRTSMGSDGALGAVQPSRETWIAIWQPATAFYMEKVQLVCTGGAMVHKHRTRSVPPTALLYGSS